MAIASGTDDEGLLRLAKRVDRERFELMFHQRTGGRYISDVIFGANDGIITTFAVVAASAGANLSSFVILIFGMANLFGDGISMGLGNFLGRRSEQAYQLGQRQKEEWEIDHLRDREVQEVRNIFRRWGFAGTELDRAVAIVTSQRRVWVDIMMRQELGIVEESSRVPWRHAVATSVAFVLAGAVPLLPFVIGQRIPYSFLISLALAFFALFAVGSARSKFTPESWWRAGLEMLLVGSCAAGVAYLIGAVLAPLTS